SLSDAAATSSVVVARSLERDGARHVDARRDGLVHDDRIRGQRLLDLCHKARDRDRLGIPALRRALALGRAVLWSEEAERRVALPGRRREQISAFALDRETQCAKTGAGTRQQARV